jgi:hypothetical protein
LASSSIRFRGYSSTTTAYYPLGSPESSRYPTCYDSSRNASPPNGHPRRLFRRLYWQGKVGFGLVMGGIVLMVLTVVNVIRPGWERDQPPGWEHTGEFAVGLIVLGRLLINAWRRTR